MITKSITFSNEQWNIIEKVAIMHCGGSRDKALDRAIELLKEIEIKTRENTEIPDKRCGTCANFCEGCKLGWKKTVKRELHTVTIYMQENDGQHCANWQNVIHHKTDEGELIYECKKGHVVRPTEALPNTINVGKSQKRK